MTREEFEKLEAVVDAHNSALAEWEDNGRVTVICCDKSGESCDFGSYDCETVNVEICDKRKAKKRYDFGDLYALIQRAGLDDAAPDTYKGDGNGETFYGYTFAR